MPSASHNWYRVDQLSTLSCKSQDLPEKGKQSNTSTLRRTPRTDDCQLNLHISAVYKLENETLIVQLENVQVRSKGLEKNASPVTYSSSAALVRKESNKTAV